MSRRREVEVSGMSFLDCICCGFGAVIILLVLTKSAEPVIAEQTPVTLAAKQEQLDRIAEENAAELDALEARLAAAQEGKAAAGRELASLKLTADTMQDKTTEVREDKTVATTLEERLATARQTLTEEMRRLQAAQPRRVASDAVAGIPVDSEYIIFVIDTSGSMQQFAWRTVVEKMNEALNAYPKVKGMQVMSDEGEYMYSTYARQWIPDTPGLRKTVLERLRNWQPFSNSSPVEGIEAAIRAFAAPDKKVSIYVFGDDFTGSSIDEVVRTVRRINPRDAKGRPQVRIHGIGFPTQYGSNGATAGGVRFATLMRILAEENGGTFVGLQTSQ
ncbi:MAG: VWA domain-containing protein [Gammaproteobacteria bacterium]|uniref:vWA domain-containing protein n=1 Tax=Nevskia sp. TaxID=1929292 RepID=UPI003F722D5B|nr:VWA domain-containing protein [Gammaproteobacteria bacterium]